MKREYSRQAEKFLGGQAVDTIMRIKSAIEKLPAGDVKKMKGTKNQYRLRVGAFRILFTLAPGLIAINKIDNRGQVYKH
ncbi:MAG: type II toxin-antitoxin system RelE/ParE family toxin [Defluviitaleaceae bacterium]|nr:type II toxin-antitoxin system RelE/ParE family toxin [Defluviitaleaceae bacterium]